MPATLPTEAEREASSAEGFAVGALLIQAVTAFILIGGGLLVPDVLITQGFFLSDLLLITGVLGLVFIYIIYAWAIKPLRSRRVGAAAIQCLILGVVVILLANIIAGILLIVANIKAGKAYRMALQVDRQQRVSRSH